MASGITENRPAFPKRAVITGGTTYGNKSLHFGHIGGVFVPADFFARFLEAVEAAGGPPPVAGTEPADPATPDGGSSGSGLRPMVWISGIIAIVLILIIIFQ